MDTRYKGSVYATARVPSPHSSDSPSDSSAHQQSATPSSPQQPNSASMQDTVTHNTVLHAAAHVSGVFVVSGLPGAAGGSVPSTAAAAPAAAAVAAPGPASSADSAKSQKLPQPTGLLALAQSQAQGPSGSRDIDENVRSTPSSHPIAAVQRENMSAHTQLSERNHQQHPISSPARVVGDDVAAPSVGVSARPQNSPPALTLIQSAMASLEIAFQTRGVSPPSSSSSAAAAAAGCPEVEMKDADAVDDPSAADLLAWSHRAHSTHCLIADINRIQSDPDRKKFLAVLSDSLDPDQRCVAVQQWLNVPSLAGLAWVCPEPRVSRLHLHFKEHSHIVAALKEIPFLVRCGALAGNAWSTGSYVCSGVERHKIPEALLLSCTPSVPIPNGMEARNSAIREYLKSIKIDVQTFWQSNRQLEQKNTANFSFFALPREADPTALARLINSIHRQHTLFGAPVSVQGPNCPQLSRCSDCHALGHTQAGCNIFGGTPVRLLFKTPLAPAPLVGLMKSLNVKSAMLGNTHHQSEWRPAYKVTLFFNTDVHSAAEVGRFRQQLQQLIDVCRSGHMQLQQAPRIVDMSFAARKKECPDCGSSDKDHLCFIRGNTKPTGRVQLQPSAAPSAAAAAAAAPSQPGMCSQWWVHKVCSKKNCAALHPKDWIPAGEDVCRDFYRTGNCKYENKCRFTHKSLAEARAAAAAAAEASAKATAAALPAVAQPRQPAQRAAASSSASASASAAAAATPTSNPFSALASASDHDHSPTRGNMNVPVSSLSMMASPTRSNSQPATCAATPTPSKKGGSTKSQRNLTLSMDAAAAAAADAQAAKPQAAKRKRPLSETRSRTEQQPAQGSAPMEDQAQ